MATGGPYEEWISKKELPCKSLFDEEYESLCLEILQCEKTNTDLEYLQILRRKRIKFEKAFIDDFYILSFQSRKIRETNDKIEKLEKSTDRKKHTSEDDLSKMKDKKGDFEKALKKRSDKWLWIGRPQMLHDGAFRKYQDRLRSISKIISVKPKIVMIGETGAGKSSFKNTVASALLERVVKLCRTSPVRSGKSATKEFRSEVMMMDRNKEFPVSFYDMEGLTHTLSDDAIGIKEIEEVIQGRVKDNSQLNNKMQTLTRVPELEDRIHCIVYVIRANARISLKDNRPLELMKQIRQKHIGEDDVRQFVIITAVDELIDKKDMANVFRYPAVRKVCTDVSLLLDIEMNCVFPVCNYTEDIETNDAINALALMPFWVIVDAGKEYIDQQFRRYHNRLH